MQRCGFCSVVSGAVRRAMCIGSRRNSSESYYRELDDQDTLKIDDRSSDLSDDAEEESRLCRRCREVPRESPRSSPRASPRTSPRSSRHASPRTSPRPSRRASPRTSRQVSPRTSPRPSRKASSQTAPRLSRQTSLKTSPRPSRQLPRKGSPMPYRQASLTPFTRLSRKTSPEAPSRPSRHSLKIISEPFWQIPETSPEPSQRALKTSPLPGPSRHRQTSPRRYRQASPRTCPRHPRRTNPDYSSQSSSSDTSPVSSLRVSQKTSPLSSLQSSTSSTWSRRRSWLEYTKGSRHNYLHSDVASDSMEEKEPKNYIMRMKHPSSRFLTLHKRRKKKLITRSLSDNTGLLDDLMLGQVQCILNQSIQWRFNAFTLETVSGGRCLPVLCVHLFQTYDLLAHFKMDASKAWKLFSLIEEGYHSSNPYHNSIHAADVTQAMHCFLQQDRIRIYLTPIEILASLLAAIAHDIDHPGFNQPFLIATGNHLAALYKNTSVLENHHWRSAVSCLVESGILDHLPPVPGLRESLMDQISSLILATDITRQAEYLTTFKTHLDENTLDMTKSEHRLLVLQIALKCADISNPCRPWEISRKWSQKVCEEFFRQGDFERRLNLPVTALCDRHTTSIPKIQTGFFKFVVTPLISEWHRFLQNDLSNQMLRNLIYNQNRWEILTNEEANEETRTETSDGDMADDEAGADNDSRKLLLPPRRASLNPPPKKKTSSNNQFRRFSVPLNVFQDVRYRNRDSSVTEEHAPQQSSTDGSQPSLHSQLSVRGHCSSSEDAECHLNAETLLPDSTIASITTPAQAVRLHTVLREGGTLNQPIRQKTLPPLESTSRDLSPAARAVPTSSRDSDSLSQFRPVPSTSTKEPKSPAARAVPTSSWHSDSLSHFRPVPSTSTNEPISPAARAVPTSRRHSDSLSLFRPVPSTSTKEPKSPAARAVLTSSWDSDSLSQFGPVPSTSTKEPISPAARAVPTSRRHSDSLSLFRPVPSTSTKEPKSPAARAVPTSRRDSDSLSQFRAVPSTSTNEPKSPAARAVPTSRRDSDSLSQFRPVPSTSTNEPKSPAARAVPTSRRDSDSLSQFRPVPSTSTNEPKSPAARAVPTSSWDSDSLSQFRAVPSTSTKEPKYNYFVVRDVKKTDFNWTPDTGVEMAGPPRNVQKEYSAAKSSRKESSTVGSQLRDNLTWMPLELESDPLLQRRRKSMPAEADEVLPIAPREKKIFEVPSVLPQILQCTFPGKETWTRRRGSAPSPVAPSELRGLTSLGSVRHSVNGSRRKPSLTVTCQQYLARTSLSVQERTQFPRRSSLPVEVMTGISTH